MRDPRSGNFASQIADFLTPAYFSTQTTRGQALQHRKTETTSTYRHAKSTRKGRKKSSDPTVLWQKPLFLKIWVESQRDGRRRRPSLTLQPILTFNLASALLRALDPLRFVAPSLLALGRRRRRRCCRCSEHRFGVIVHPQAAIEHLSRFRLRQERPRRGRQMIAGSGRHRTRR